MGVRKEFIAVGPNYEAAFSLGTFADGNRCLQGYLVFFTASLGEGGTLDSRAHQGRDPNNHPPLWAGILRAACKSKD